MLSEVDVAVIGGGAAGLMCAIEAAKRGRRVLVLEQNPRPGRKILISGGGRCNFTNLNARAENFISGNPHFAKSALARFGAREFTALVERHRIPYHEKTLGQLFCDRTAADILNMLETECAAAGARIENGRGASDVKRDGGGYVVETRVGAVRAASVAIASGGLSIPKTGANGFGYEIARRFGLSLAPCRPALTPLLFGGEDRERWRGLEGVAAPARVRTGGQTFDESLLFTHRGLSGPAVLQASSYWRPGAEIEIDLLPGMDLAAFLRERRNAGDRSGLRAQTARFLPKRLADRWFQTISSDKPVAGAGDRELAALDAALHAWRFIPAGTEGYEKAEVTAGGVDTSELSSRTMEAHKAPGLFFIGEVVDVTGQLGGYNFQWAWASGYAAGQTV
jgi:predicted Rossmann fold flavoprotein